MQRWIVGMAFIVLALVLCACQLAGRPETTPLTGSLSSEGASSPIPLGTGGEARQAETPAGPTPIDTQIQEETMGLKLTSSAFNEGDMIPKPYTCDGQDISPPLAWTGAPAGTKSFALICDDPDAPVGVWDHWVCFNLPPGLTGLPEAVPRTEVLPSGGLHGRNSWGKIGYGGPCPPSGVHRYFFKLYALDTELSLKAGATKKDVEKTMQGHILAEAQLMGRYKRS